LSAKRARWKHSYLPSVRPWPENKKRRFFSFLSRAVRLDGVSRYQRVLTKTSSGRTMLSEGASKRDISTYIPGKWTKKPHRTCCTNDHLSGVLCIPPCSRVTATRKFVSTQRNRLPRSPTRFARSSLAKPRR